MTPSEIIQELIGCGFELSLNDDGEKINIRSTKGKLSDEQRQAITENKQGMLEYLQKQAWRPKVATGAIHYIAHRSQRWMTNLSFEQLTDLRALLVPKFTDSIWSAYEKKNRWELITALKAYYQQVRAYVRVAGEKPIVHPSIVKTASRRARV